MLTINTSAMKNILMTLIVCNTIFISAQTIPVEGYVDYKYDIPDGAYIKDVNNVLDKFVGTWTGTYDQKNYSFFVTKVKMYFDYVKFTEDILLMRYTITDAGGNTIEDTTKLPDDHELVIEGQYMDEGGKYVLDYIGREFFCGQGGDVLIGMMEGSNNTQMFLTVFGSETWPSCTTGYAEPLLPYKKNYVVLTKQ